MKYYKLLALSLIASLAASAGQMSTEQVMKSLMDIMDQNMP